MKRCPFLRQMITSKERREYGYGCLSLVNKWSHIRRDLSNHYLNLARHIFEAEEARSILPTIGVLADAARFLDSLDHQSAPIEKRSLKHQGFLATSEMSNTSVSCLQLLDFSKGVSTRFRWSDTTERVAHAVPTYRRNSVPGIRHFSRVWRTDSARL